MLIMAGSLDDKSQFKPTVSVFCEQAPSWVVMPTEYRKPAALLHLKFGAGSPPATRGLLLP